MGKPAYRTYPVRVSAIEPLAPNFVRVRFTSDELADLGWDGPDQRIKVILPLPHTGVSSFPTGEDWYSQWRLLPTVERNPIRTYTIRKADRQACELVVDFVAHGDTGPASRWISTAAVADELLVIGPDATSDSPGGGYEWLPGRATTLLLAGDETAVPAISTILESLTDSAHGTPGAPEPHGAAFLEVPGAADILDLRVPAGITVTWLPRDGSQASAHGELLSEAVRAWAECFVRAGGLVESAGADLTQSDEAVLWDVPPPPEDPGLYAWIAGEAGTVTRLRRYLVKELGIDRSRVAFMGYWKQGQAEN